MRRKRGIKREEVLGRKRERRMGEETDGESVCDGKRKRRGTR